MPRYIEESELIDGRVSNDPVVIAVKCAKTADVVERKKGEWYDVGSLSCRCSECGCKSPKEYLFCPNCGAEMEEDEDDR